MGLALDVLGRDAACCAVPGNELFYSGKPGVLEAEKSLTPNPSPKGEGSR
jgi:hypothetical protein